MGAYVSYISCFSRYGEHTVENALDVDVEDNIPALLFREVVERRDPRHARVVDENMYLALLGFDLVHKLVAARFILCVVSLKLAKRAEYEELTLRSATTYSQLPGPILFSPSAV